MGIDEVEAPTLSKGMVPLDNLPKWLQKELDKEKREREEFKAFMRMDYPVPGLLKIDHKTFGQYFYGRGACIVNTYLITTGHYSVGLILIRLVGITAGAHRYWTHKSYKATLPLQILLMIMFSTAGHWSIYKWVLDHRIHHRYTDTDKDPHNSKRGFWFSQGLWLVSERHPEHWKALKSFDMPDLEKNPVILFNSNYTFPLIIFWYFLVPVSISLFFFEVSIIEISVLNCLRWCFVTHAVSTVNSIAHMFGTKTYDKYIAPAENKLVALLSSGEGWHNYHHTFPWDYKTSEFGWRFNIATIFIDFFTWIGWAHDLKSVKQQVMMRKVIRSGGGTHASCSEKGEHQKWDSEVSHFDKTNNGDTTFAWGWDDESLSEESRRMTKILRRQKT